MSRPLSPAHLRVQAALRAKLTPEDARLVMWWGVVNTAPTGTPSKIGVNIGGSIAVTLMRYDASLTPTVGLTVWGLAVGGDYIAVGKLAP